ncbi:MAG: CYTH and CHAD domain-containing protein [Ramlibacter sp.]|nr:CYTH and CHAD domain-containing protein [Ramlibacter sp.]
MSIEFELKLQVPPESTKQVADALDGAPRQRMRAIYFDSAGNSLASHRVSVRLRKEGREWVQTAKAPGRHGHARLEHNVPLGRSAVAPVVSVMRHAGSAVEPALCAALGVHDLQLAPALLARFETDVFRVIAKVTDSYGNCVEIAFDRGEIRAGTAKTHVCEIEFERLQGDVAAAVHLARQWAGTHNLWLSVSSKAQRGDLLATGHAFPEALHATQPKLARRASAASAVADMALHALDQVFANATSIGHGSEQAVHIHQLRVGLRRLRVVLRDFKGCVPGLDMRHESALADVFCLLGVHRDRYNLATHIAPRIVADGGPTIQWPAAASGADLARAVRAQAFQQALLLVFEAAVSVPQDTAARKDSSALERVSQRLAKLHAAVTRDSKLFLRLDEERQHRVRKRLKRLRYTAEFAASLFGSHRAARYLDALKPLQEALGMYNDELGALAVHRERAKHDPDARFGEGWLAARRPFNAQACALELARFVKRKPFWD